MHTAGPFEAILFDLDGTLLDSLPGIEASARYAAETCMPERRVPSLRSLIGPPIGVIFALLWPDLEAERLNRLVNAYRQHYDAQGCLLSELYPGAVQTLDYLRGRGLRLFVLTNKPIAPTSRILKHTGILPVFTDIVSPDSVQPPFKSKTDGALMLRGRFHLDPHRTLLVGDGVDDAQAAAACGYAFLAVGYGYGEAAAHAGLTKLAELKRLPDIVEMLFGETLAP